MAAFASRLVSVVPHASASGLSSVGVVGVGTAGLLTDSGRGSHTLPARV